MSYLDRIIASKTSNIEIILECSRQVGDKYLRLRKAVYRNPNCPNSILENAMINEESFEIKDYVKKIYNSCLE